MQINQAKFNEVAAEAEARTNDKRWQNAIDKACADVTSGWWVITELADSIAVTTESGATYYANGSCQCKAFELGQPCKHRALARLITLYRETETASAPRIVRSIESDRTGQRYAVVRCDGWAI